MGWGMRFSLVIQHFISTGWLALLAGFCGLMLGKPVAAAQPAGTPTILVVGDSLSAEYGLVRGTGWVALLEQKLQAENIKARLVNASISGETTSGGASRLGALLQQHKPSHVVIELGGNDALRGLPLKATQDNLLRMTQAAKAADAKVLLLGMQVPPNYGKDYSAQFSGMYTEVARQEKTGLVPFFLKGVAQDINLFQPDRIHPNAQAQPTMLGNVWPELKKQL